MRDLEIAFATEASNQMIADKQQRDSYGRAFEKAFAEYHQHLRAIATGLIQQYRADVEPDELVSDLYLKLTPRRVISGTLFGDYNEASIRLALPNNSKREEYRFVNQCRTLMNQIVRNMARRTGRQPFVSSETLDRIDCDTATEARSHDLDDALESLASKHPRLSQLVHMVYLDEQSVGKAAEEFGISRQHAQRELRRAIDTLRRLFRSTTQDLNYPFPDRRNRASVAYIPFSPEHLQELLEDSQRIQALSPDQFEELIANRLTAMGLGVKRVGSINKKDGGIDIVAWPESSCAFPFLIATQVKHHHTDARTSVSDVRDFHGVLALPDSCFHIGLLVTNTSFSADAVWFAEQNRRLLRLRDLTDLRRWLQDDFLCEFEWREVPNEIEVAPGIKIEIPKRELWVPK